MGLIDFVKSAGEKIFGGDDEKKAPTPEAKAQVKASALVKHVQLMNIPFKKLDIKVTGDSTVLLGGEVAEQEQCEKIALTVGNVEGVAKVDNNMVVSAPKPEAKYHTVVSGDTLSKISKAVYGDPMKYEAIFEANKPMLKHVDKIYPGQVLRIPVL